MADDTLASVWITYAWVDDKGGDFSYLVQELRSIGVQAKYDRVTIIPGQCLWDQIAAQICEGDIDGWAYLITPDSLQSTSCREELAYALDRALNARGRAFPLIGLLHGISIDNVPPALRVRLCVSLADPNWKEEIKAGLEDRPPEVPVSPQTKYIWTFHEKYGDSAGQCAIEVRPRFGEAVYWRFVLPAAAQVVRWGHGPSMGGAIGGNKVSMVETEGGELSGTPTKWFGSGDRLSPGVSAYIVFDSNPPDFVCFGEVKEEYGPPQELEIRRTKAWNQTG